VDFLINPIDTRPHLRKVDRDLGRGASALFICDAGT
jgi:hypothetical protein